MKRDNKLKIKAFFIAFFYAFVLVAVGKPYFDIPSKDLEKAFLDESSKYLVPNQNIRDYFTFIRQLGGGKSGAGIFEISPKASPGERRIFKLLSEIKDSSNIWTDTGFREIYFSKRLSELQNNKYLPENLKANIFFPTFYGFGITDSANPFQPFQKATPTQKFPFYLMEKLDGMSFVDFAVKPDEARAKLSYDLSSAPKGAIFSILFQVTLALYNAYKEFQFVHLDAHPGNIFLLNSPTDLIINVNGVKIKLVGPKIKIIDFDQSEIEGAHPSHRGIYSYRPYLGGDWDVYKAENKNILPPVGLALKAYQSSKNSDVRIINFLIHAFKERFKKEANFDVSNQYFYTLDDLIQFFANNAHKFGLTI